MSGWGVKCSFIANSCDYSGFFFFYSVQKSGMEKLCFDGVPIFQHIIKPSDIKGNRKIVSKSWNQRYQFVVK